MRMTGFAETGHSWLANTGPTMTADGPVAASQLLGATSSIAASRLPLIAFADCQQATQLEKFNDSTLVRCLPLVDGLVTPAVSIEFADEAGC